MAEPPFNSRCVEFAGVRRRVSLACVPDARWASYVLVHAGVAISRIHADEAAKVLDDLEQLDLKEEIRRCSRCESPIAKPALKGQFGMKYRRRIPPARALRVACSTRFVAPRPVRGRSWKFAAGKRMACCDTGSTVHWKVLCG